MILGFILGWKREGVAALLIASGWTVWHASEGRMQWNFFQAPLLVAGLYALCWWAANGRKTRLVVGATLVLATALGIGRLLVPANVFVLGSVLNAQDGKAVANAELRLLLRSTRVLEKGDPPNARSAKDGRFSLYVGWYDSGTTVTIAAPGYTTLTTNLGPRGFGRRTVHCDFQLQPALDSNLPVPPVVITTVPPSGAAGVDPTMTELRVTFSKAMKDGNWSWVDLKDGSFPTMTGEPHFLEDGRTCVLPVKLQPGKVYATWLNVDNFQAFQDEDGQPAVPYLLIFETRK